MKRRLNLLLLGYSLGLWLTGCHKHVYAKSDIVNRGTYAYEKINDGEYVVAATNDTELHKAFHEIGCGTKFICDVESSGELYDVVIHTK